MKKGDPGVSIRMATAATRMMGMEINSNIEPSSKSSTRLAASYATLPLLARWTELDSTLTSDGSACARGEPGSSIGLVLAAAGLTRCGKSGSTETRDSTDTRAAVLATAREVLDIPRTSSCHQ